MCARHIVALTAFALLAIVWSFPLVLHLSTHLPGAGIGDNVVCLWNFWWMRMALASAQDFFHTTYLFAPVGVDLTLHTHTALSAFIGATLLKAVPVVTALNLTILAALALNGFCSYLLAWHITRDRAAAMVAGIIFGTSPYLAAHLNGHFNLTTAWTVPLFALTVADAARGSMKSAILSGVLLAATVYIDYYYVVYEIALAVCVFALAAREWSLTMRTTDPYPGWCAVLVGLAIVLDVLVLAVIIMTGPGSIELGPIQLSIEGTFNPRQLFWLFVALALWICFRPRLSTRPRDTWSSVGAGHRLAAMLGAFLMLASPLVWKGLGMLAHGEYVTQQYYWRSAPVGVDIMTLVLGNPFHGLWGSSVRHLYTEMHIDIIESGAWLGIVPLALLAHALRRKLGDPIVRQWLVIGTVFFVWALGSHVYAVGQNTGMIMPGALLRYIPIASNARIPGRAMVMVYLAIAVLAAVGAAEYRIGRSRPALALLVMATLVFADFSAAPFPIVRMECPAIYRVLRDRPESGALAELPLGVGDGFGGITAVDHRMFVCQTIHRRPLVGGVLARLQPHVLATYAADPLLAAWLRLSGARAEVGSVGPPPNRVLAGERLKADHISFVMLNRRSASPELLDYVDHVLPLTLLARDEDRALYVVAPRGRTGGGPSD